MDFLDPLYQRRHIIRLYTGYALVAIAIFLAVTMLLLLAKGFQLSKDGQVIQNGLIFASSKPINATVYLDGITTNKDTNTRLNIPEGSYELELKRDGYRSWQHRISVLGGHLTRYDYPLLIPETLTTSPLQTFSAKAPGVVSQTPDSRWLLVQQDASVPSFVVFDTKNSSTKPATIVLPTSVYAAGGKQTWSAISWADDKVHLLLRHGYGTEGRSEYVLLNREHPNESVNISAKLKIDATKLTFADNKFDSYYLYSAADKTLRSGRLNSATTTVVATNVTDYDTYKADTVLYVSTTSDKTKPITTLHLKQGSDDVVIRQLTAKPKHYVAVSAYSGSLYAAVDDIVAGKPFVYVYKNPLSQLKAGVKVVPVAALRIAPSYLSFSFGGRFVLAEHGTSFATYDAEYKQQTSYTLTQPIDKPQSHAVWLDGAHLQYVSNKQLLLFDFDGQNPQILMSAVQGDQVFYDVDFRHVFAINSPTTAQKNYALTSTALRIPADL